MLEMAGDVSGRRTAPLKTYSRRVNKSSQATTGKKIQEDCVSDLMNSAKSSERRVLKVEGDSSGVLGCQHGVGKSSSSTTMQDTQRQAMVDLDVNTLATQVSQADPAPGASNSPRIANSESPNEHTSRDTCDPGEILNPSKKRQTDDSVTVDLPTIKRVKVSSIKNYFKSVPASTSPAMSSSPKVFSDSVDPPSSPPSSPLSDSEILKFESSRKRVRRTLSLKPQSPSSMSLPSSNNSDYDRESKKKGKTGMKEHTERTLPCLDEDLGGDPDENLGASPSPSEWLAQNAGGVSCGDSPRSDPTNTRKQKSSNKTQFHQLRFITEHNPVILCKDCHFMYNRTIDSEVRAHTAWHKDPNPGIRPTKSTLGEPVWSSRELEVAPHKVYASRAGASVKEKEWFENALEISMQRGLDGPSTTNLWTLIKDPSESGGGELTPKFKVFVYTIGVEIVSLILVERINQGGAFYSGPATHDEFGKLNEVDEMKTQQYVNLDHRFPVAVSADRVWTDARYRRKGYATRVLDLARSHFIRNTQLSRSQIAFSVPTQDGHAFATKYCERAFGDTTPFVVNVDDARVVVEDGKLKDKWAVERLQVPE